MKNLLLIAALAVTIVAVSNEAVLAGGGGGKSNSKAKFYIKNINPIGQQGIAVWVRPTDTELPATLGALKKQLTYIGPGKSYSTSRMKKGSYDIATIGANTIADLPDETELDISAAIANRTFKLNGVDMKVYVNNNGIFDNDLVFEE